MEIYYEDGVVWWRRIVLWWQVEGDDGLDVSEKKKVKKKVQT